MLLLGALYLAFSMKAWTPFWQARERATVSVHAASPNALALGPELSKAATIKTYGPLATAAQAAADREAKTNAELALALGSDNEPGAAPPVSSGPISTADRVAGIPADAPVHLIHRTFSLNDRRGFAFTVPAHTLHPKLSGSFHTTNGSPTDLLLMNDSQYADFIRGRNIDAVRSQGGSASSSIGWELPATILDPQKYHLVFFNAAGDSSPFEISADLVVTFN